MDTTILNVTFWDSSRQIVFKNDRQLKEIRVNEEYLQPEELSNPYLYSFYEMWKEKLMKPLTVDEYKSLIEDVYFLKERFPFINFSFQI